MASWSKTRTTKHKNGRVTSTTTNDKGQTSYSTSSGGPGYRVGYTFKGGKIIKRITQSAGGWVKTEQKTNTQTSKFGKTKPAFAKTKPAGARRPSGGRRFRHSAGGGIFALLFFVGFISLFTRGSDESAEKALSISSDTAELSPASAIVQSSESVTLSDLKNKNLGIFAHWESVTAEQFPGIAWIHDLDRSSGALQRITLDGRLFFGGNICEPHDCSTNRLAFLIAADGTQSLGLLAAKNTSNEEVLIGEVSEKSRAVLRSLLQ
jgi:hypothetical protein